MKEKGLRRTSAHPIDGMALYFGVKTNTYKNCIQSLCIFVQGIPMHNYCFSGVNGGFFLAIYMQEPYPKLVRGYYYTQRLESKLQNYNNMSLGGLF